MARVHDPDDERPPPGIKSAAVNRPMAPLEATRVTYKREQYAGLLAPRVAGSAPQSRGRPLSVDAEGEVHLPPERKRPREPGSGSAAKPPLSATGLGAKAEATARRIASVVENAGRPRSSLGSRAL